MNINGFLRMALLNILSATFVNCSVLTMGLWAGTAYALNYFSYDYVRCKFRECCAEPYVDPNIAKLSEMLERNLYGQEIAHRTVISALRGHINSESPPKALSMSFHGPPGTGKTYISRMIAKAFYAKGSESDYYHFFSGRNDFPLESMVPKYKKDLYETVVKSLQECERSIFVFDEVDKMPEGLLDVLVPFLDYTKSHKFRTDSGIVSARKTYAIYIFLSNTGSTQIVRRMLTFWEQGKRREELGIEDFENIISVGAFNERGGFYYSDTIEASLIDHYVPFLPLEETHVKKCLKRAFLDRGVRPTESMIKEGMKHVTFGPAPHNLYSNSGCKRLEQKAASIIFSENESG